MAKETMKQDVENKYPLQDLIENSEALTGYKKEVAVGALSNCSEIELSREEFKKKVKDFLDRKVK